MTGLLNPKSSETGLYFLCVILGRRIAVQVSFRVKKDMPFNTSPKVRGSIRKKKWCASIIARGLGGSSSFPGLTGGGRFFDRAAIMLPLIWREFFVPFACRRRFCCQSHRVVLDFGRGFSFTFAGDVYACRSYLALVGGTSRRYFRISQKSKHFSAVVGNLGSQFMRVSGFRRCSV